MICLELGRESLSCKLVSICDKNGVYMTLDELKILQAGFNLVSNAKNICMFSFLVVLTIHSHFGNLD